MLVVGESSHSSAQTLGFSNNTFCFPKLINKDEKNKILEGFNRVQFTLHQLLGVQGEPASVVTLFCQWDFPACA